MAKIKLRLPFAEISGKLGDYYFRKSKKKGEVVLAKCPKKSSRAQKNNRERMAKANEYARAAMADPVVSLIYEKRGAQENRQPYRVAVSDFCKGKDLRSKPLKAPRSRKGGRNNGKD